MNRASFNKRFGERVRTFRTQRGLTLTELGKYPSLDLSGQSISNVEAGRQQLTVYQMFCFAAALNASVGELLAGLVEPNENLPAPSKEMKNIIKDL